MFFTKKDEEKEISQLSTEELDIILKDIYGLDTTKKTTTITKSSANNNYNKKTDTQRREENNNNCVNDENNDNADDADDHDYDGNDDRNITIDLLNQVHDAIERLPPDQSGMYWRACVEVDEEFTFDYFLRCENYDPNKAAQRICSYWNTRYEVFGEDYAFRPITLIDGSGGNSALSQQVMSYMVQIPNWARILPNDQYGRTVICFDTTILQQLKSQDEEILLRIVWFVFHVALQRRSTHDHGIVIININLSSNWRFHSNKFIKLATTTASSCIPARICCIHGCVSSLAASISVPIFKYFYPREVRLRHRMHRYCVQKNDQSLVKELECYGLDGNALPKSIGGNYTKRPKWIDNCENILASTTACSSSAGARSRRRTKKQRQ